MTMRWIAMAAVALAAALAPVQPVAAASRAYAPGEGGGSARATLASAWRGNMKAQTRLGFMYENGRGMPQNFVLAAMWYGRAAERGDPAAQYLLGLMYDKGRGVPQDDIVAHMWLSLATARAGDRDRENYARIRDAVGSKMTRAQVAQSQWLAYDWVTRRGYR